MISVQEISRQNFARACLTSPEPVRNFPPVASSSIAVIHSGSMSAKVSAFSARPVRVPFRYMVSLPKIPP